MVYLRSTFILWSGVGSDYLYSGTRSERQFDVQIVSKNAGNELIPDYLYRKTAIHRLHMYRSKFRRGWGRKTGVAPPHVRENPALKGIGAERLSHQANGGFCRRAPPSGRGLGWGRKTGVVPPPVRNKPALEGGRPAYVIVNNYRTNYDVFQEVYLLGIQLDIK